MTRKEPDDWWREGVARGQHKLADTLRLLVLKTAPALFDQLDFDDDEIFLDPLLFAYFTDPAPEQSLTHLLCSRILPECRPAVFRLRCDADGRVYLPGIGEWCIAGAGREVELSIDTTSASFSWQVDGRPMPVEWRTPDLIPGTAIEVMRSSHSLFRRFFVDEAGVPAAIETAKASADHIPHLQRACILLRQYCPDLWSAIAATTRRFVLYRSSVPNSFATLSAHGAIFCNVTTAIDEVFFLEDVAHQAGHVLFNALTLEKERFFMVDPLMPFGGDSYEAVEVRTLYAAVHGLFTYTTIGEALSACYERTAFAPARKSHELLGRLGLILRKFESDLSLLDRPELYSNDGKRCWRYFTNVYRRLHNRYGAQTSLFDYSNQPYVFSYPLFAEQNPRLPVLSTEEAA